MAAVAALHQEFKKRNTFIFGISTDSVYSHKIFAETSPSARRVQYPLITDKNMNISSEYGALDKEKGVASRTTVIIDTEGYIVSKLVYPSEVGRNAYEVLRLIEGLQFARETDLGVPANWQPGEPGIARDFKYVGKI